MFKNEAAILQAAAALTAAEHTAAAIRETTATNRIAIPRVHPVRRLIQMLREMEKQGLIDPGFAPDEPSADDTPPAVERRGRSR